MRITDTETMVCAVKVDLSERGVGREIVIVRVRTDEGITGLSYLPTLVAPFGGHGTIAATIIGGALKNIILGEDPMAVERLWEKMFNGTYRWGRRGIVVQSIAAVDIALWDIKAKAAKLPLYKLLGGYRERVPVYANTAFEMPAEKIAEKAAEYAGMGFTAVKFRVGRNVVDYDEATLRLRLVREAIGDNVRIMCDANGSFDFETAVRSIRSWEKYDIHWLEEPLPADDIPGYVKLSRAVGVPLATGENHSTRAEFRELIERQAVRIVQPDAIRVGGITEWLKVAATAASFGVPVAPHAVQEVHVHLVAAFPIGTYIEFFPADNPFHTFMHQLLKVAPEIKQAQDSTIGVPQVPGLGFEINEEVAAATRIA